MRHLAAQRSRAVERGQGPALALLLFGLASCAPMPAKERGEQLFNAPLLSTSQFNAVSCASCHTTGASSEQPRIAGTLHNSAFRTSYWGGYQTRLIDATNFCLVYFMRGDPLTKEDPKGRALYEYLVSLSPERDLPAVPLAFVENVTALPRGDAGRGRTVYDRACRGCHGAPHTGKDKNATFTPIIPEASQQLAAQFNVSADLVVVEKVRHGQFFGVGGTMPPFSRDALSDEQLSALLGYLAE